MHRFLALLPLLLATQALAAGAIVEKKGVAPQYQVYPYGGWMISDNALEARDNHCWRSSDIFGTNGAPIDCSVSVPSYQYGYPITGKTWIAGISVTVDSTANAVVSPDSAVICLGVNLDDGAAVTALSEEPFLGPCVTIEAGADERSYHAFLDQPLLLDLTDANGHLFCAQASHTDGGTANDSGLVAHCGAWVAVKGGNYP